MKRTILVALFLLAPSFCSALCMNYGHAQTSYDLSAHGQVATDLANMKADGITCIRTSYMGWNNTQSEALALFAQSKGFYVIIGGDWGTFSQSQFNTYESEVIQEAKWAQQHKIPQLSLGNEQEYRLSGLSISGWQADVVHLSQAVRGVYSGSISYETSGDFASAWAAEKSWGDLNLLGLNLYCGYACNLNDIEEVQKAHGKTSVYISETNCDLSNPSTGCGTSDAAHAAEVKSDDVKLEALGIPEYFFTWSACNGADGVPSYWGIYQCGQLAQPLTLKALL